MEVFRYVGDFFIPKHSLLVMKKLEPSNNYSIRWAYWDKDNKVSNGFGFAVLGDMKIIDKIADNLMPASQEEKNNFAAYLRNCEASIRAKCSTCGPRKNSSGEIEVERRKLVPVKKGENNESV